MAKIRIVDELDIGSMVPGRFGKRDVLVRYTVDEQRTYDIVLPAETFTSELAIKAISEREKERAKLIGKTFEI